MPDNHYPIKQVIILRKDINYGTKGKQIAQACHASVGVLANIIRNQNQGYSEINGMVHVEAFISKDVYNWIYGDFAKIALAAPTLDDLLDIEKKAQEAGLHTCLITDNGTTVWKEPTISALSIGPAKSEEIDEITGNLKLL
jgi:PTH2 family peptidyl-tRNA hydrolase